MRHLLTSWRDRLQEGLSARLATRRDRWVAGTGLAVVVAGLITGGVLLYQATHQGKQITAYFTESIGIYPGSTVRILDIPVGRVDSVHPQGGLVKVTMTVGHGIAVPAGAQAVVVTSSVVSDRFIELTPAYTRGPQMASGAVIPAARTAVPVEIDQIYASLNQLTKELGPAGANKNGALSNLIKTGASNLGTNGQNLNNAITQFSGLSKTLGGSAGNLFTTVKNLQQFTTMLKNNNSQVILAEQQLADVSTFLAADRQDLAGAVTQLGTALGQVSTFIGSNRALIKDNVSKLATITAILVRERASLAEALDSAPLAVDNVVGAYNATTRTLNGRGDLLEFIFGKGATASTSALPGGTGAPNPAGAAPAGTVAVPTRHQGSLPPLPLPAVGTVYGTPQALLAGGH